MKVLNRIKQKNSTSLEFNASEQKKEEFILEAKTLPLSARLIIVSIIASIYSLPEPSKSIDSSSAFSLLKVILGL